MKEGCMKSNKKLSVISSIKQWFYLRKERKQARKVNNLGDNMFLEERKKLGRDACNMKINK